ncbi:MAG: DUF6101 family protein [Methyloligellaceae bacterium]
MRRQTQPQGLAARWHVRPLDIDPFRLPVEFALDVVGASGHPARVRDHITISRTMVSVKRVFRGGPVAFESLALEEFAGVTVRFEACGDGAGEFVVSINLHHHDPRLCIPLHMSFDMDDVGARCQSWARALRLPLLLPALDGSWREAEPRLGRLVVGHPCFRDARLPLRARRSQMASLREVGVWQVPKRFEGAEIIARN